MDNPEHIATFLDPPNVPLLRPLWSLLDGIWGVLKSSSGVLVYNEVLEPLVQALQAQKTYHVRPLGLGDV